MKQFLMEEFQKRPRMVLEDCVKLLFQRFFGPGHLIADRQTALTRLENEISSLPEGPEEPLFEPLGNGFCRMNLRPAVKAGFSPNTLCGMFCESAKDTQRMTPAFLSALDDLQALLLEGLLPFDAQESIRWLENYRLAGCPAQSHSEAYRRAYQPAYRVVDEMCARYARLFLCIDARRPARIAIDGRCGSGKSTLAGFVGGVYAAPVIHVDDFFLQPFQRTPQRLAEPGGNMDRERLLEEVLWPLCRGEDVVFRPFSCAEQKIGPPQTVPAAPMTLVEGVYCLHPSLRFAYDFKVFLSVDPLVQRQRILARNGEKMLERFVAEWIPREERYFDAFGVRQACDLVFD